MKKFLIMLYVRLRWAYFHISPSYIKFCVKSEDKEYYFYNVKKNSIHYQLVWNDDNS